MVRCFIAIDIPDEIKEELAKVQKQLPEFKGKLTEKDNLHLTFKFLGEISDEKADEVKKRLKKIKFKKFTAKLGELGLFSPSFIKILWIKIENCDGLQIEIDESIIPIAVRSVVDQINLQGMAKEETCVDKDLADSKVRLANLLKKKEETKG